MGLVENIKLFDRLRYHEVSLFKIIVTQVFLSLWIVYITFITYALTVFLGEYIKKISSRFDRANY